MHSDGVELLASELAERSIDKGKVEKVCKATPGAS